MLIKDANLFIIAAKNYRIMARQFICGKCFCKNGECGFSHAEEKCGPVRESVLARDKEREHASAARKRDSSNARQSKDKKERKPKVVQVCRDAVNGKCTRNKCKYSHNPKHIAAAKGQIKGSSKTKKKRSKSKGRKFRKGKVAGATEEATEGETEAESEAPGETPDLPFYPIVVEEEESEDNIEG